jgi:hypothetical protein
VKKILSCIIVATVSVSIYCGEQRAIVSVMQPSAEGLTPIKSLEEVEEFTGKLVAYKRGPFFCESPLVIKNPDNYHYGYLSKLSCYFAEDTTYVLSRLLSKDQSTMLDCTCTQTLTKSSIERHNILMRKVTLEEMVAIIRELSEGKTRLGYYDLSNKENIKSLIHPSILDLINVVYFGQYSQLLESPESREFPELVCCMKQQYPNVPKELRRCMLRYLGLLKLQGCVEY